MPQRYKKVSDIDHTVRLCPRTLAPEPYSHAVRFSEGLAGVVKSDKLGFINKKGKLVIPCQYDYQDDGFGFLDFARQIYKQKYEILTLTDNLSYIYSEGLVAVSKNGKYGAINKKGQVVIPFTYDKIGCFREGFAPASVNNKWGYIDKYNSEVIPYRFDKAMSFSCSYALVYVNDEGFMYINKFGRTLIKLSDPNLELFPYSFHEGLATAQIVDTFIESPQVTYVDNFKFPKDKYIVCDTHGNCSFSGEYKSNYLKEIETLQNQIDDAYQKYLSEEQSSGPDWIEGTWRYSGTLYDPYVGRLVIDLLLVIDRDNSQMLLKDIRENEIKYVGSYEFEDNQIEYDSRNGSTYVIPITDDGRLEFGNGKTYKKVSSDTDMSKYL